MIKTAPKTTENLTIAHASPQDFWDVYCLYKILIGSEPLFSETDYLKYIKDENKGISLVKNSESQTLGLIAWIVWPGALSFPLDICFVQDMVVLPNYRNTGIGSFMLEHVKRWSKENGIHIIHLQTDSSEAVNFYTHNGFEQRNTGLFCFLDK